MTSSFTALQALLLEKKLSAYMIKS